MPWELFPALSAFIVSVQEQVPSNSVQQFPNDKPSATISDTTTFFLYKLTILNQLYNTPA